MFVPTCNSNRQTSLELITFRFLAQEGSNIRRRRDALDRVPPSIGKVGRHQTMVVEEKFINGNFIRNKSMLIYRSIPLLKAFERMDSGRHN